MEELKQTVRFCRALSVETRMSIIASLRGGPLCVGALARRLNISQSAVSQHLRVLKDANLVKPVRKGLFLHYEIQRGVFARRCDDMKDLLTINSEKKPHECRGKCGKS